MSAQLPVEMNEASWEALWAPYDEDTYQFVLEHVSDEDTVLDIGAGDLRLAYRLAGRVRRVYAIEKQAELIWHPGSAVLRSKPANLSVMVGDARQLEFPRDVTVGVLLMRHCLHFQEYAERLQQAGCRWLITNARWRIGVERIDLQSQRVEYRDNFMGWYSCWCGATGFKPGPAEALTREIVQSCREVNNCPVCLENSGKQLL